MHKSAIQLSPTFPLHALLSFKIDLNLEEPKSFKVIVDPSDSDDN